ncbi:MAG: response regulator transcription factor [Clostridia bacterium]|nr:response regulator transcription factor [Clostridia bacterium]
MKIAICDDERIQTQSLTQKLSLFAETRHKHFEIQAYSSAEAFLFAYRENRDVDILFLDIEMGQMNGIELAREIRADNETVQIVFITGYPDYIGEGYDVDALHYLLKPVDTQKLYEVCERALANLQKQPRFHLLPVGKEVVRVYEKDILYAETQGHYLRLVTKKGEHRLRMTLPELSTRLGNSFFKCSRSYLAGLLHVSRITKTSVILEDGTELPLGKGLYDEINTALIRFLRGL